MKKLLLLTGLVLLAAICFAQSVGIGTTTPNNSAILDLSSTSKGLLLPRMNTTQRNSIASPTVGLSIFNTDDQCTDIFDGAYWIKNCGLKQIDSITIPANSWRQLNNFAGIARTQAVAFSIGNKGYIGGGRDNSIVLTDLWEFDPATGVWIQKASLTQLGKTDAVGFSITNKGYVGTGWLSGPTKDFWEYDPATNTWLQKADFGGSGRENAVGFSIGNKGYIGTGFDGTSATNDFWEFDPAINTWTQKANFFFGRFNAVGFSIGNKGYIGTGFGSSVTELYVYDPSTNSWGPTATSAGPARTNAIGFSIGNKGYVGLGLGTDNATLNDLWEYDPTTNAWTQKTNFSGTGRTDACSFVIGSKGYVGTGNIYPFGLTNELWEYRTSSYNAAAYTNQFSLVTEGQVTDGIWTKSNLTDQPQITTTGFVGINNNDPRFSLDIKGQLRLRSQGMGKTTGIWLNNLANTDTVLFMGMMDDNTAGFYRNGDWKWVVNTTTGNTGIGIANPTTKLHVVGTTYLNGNVGISTPNPSVPLHVTGNTILNGNVSIGPIVPAFPISFPSSIGDKISLSGNTAGAAHYGFGIQSGLLQVYSDVIGSDIAFGYGRSGSFTERMRIKGSGNVGIGTANPSHLFEIAGPASAIPVTFVIGNKGGFGPAALEFVSDYGISSQWRPGYIRSNDAGVFTGTLEFYTNGTGSSNLYGNVKGLVVQNGITYTATGTVSSWSDARLKENIQPFESGLEVINKINPVTFYYNNLSPFNPGKQQVGIIAQELEKVAPYMVDKTSTKEIDDMRSVNNQAYIFLLINAVKELSVQNEKQQQKIDAQQKQIEQLLKKMQ